MFVGQRSQAAGAPLLALWDRSCVMLPQMTNLWDYHLSYRSRALCLSSFQWVTDFCWRPSVLGLFWSRWSAAFCCPNTCGNTESVKQGTVSKNNSSFDITKWKWHSIIYFKLLYFVASATFLQSGSCFQQHDFISLDFLLVVIFVSHTFCCLTIFTL